MKPALKAALAALAILLAATPLMTFPLAAQDNAGLRSALTGVYTVAQADQGHQLYAFRCARCHDTGFLGAPRWDAARLGADFQGHTLFDLADMIHTSMPVDEPGTTSRADAAALTAYILSLLEVPPGDSELPADDSVLQQIRIDLPKK
jgi:mono/diheme cytochrome c family protein